MLQQLFYAILTQAGQQSSKDGQAESRGIGGSGETSWVGSGGRAAWGGDQVHRRHRHCVQQCLAD